MSTSLAAGREERPLYATYGLILATFLGTMGLPHVVVRFYTSPHGVAARRTTVAVLGLIGAFYLLPPVYGALGRLYAPELTLTGDADAAVLLLPDRMIGGVGGDLLGRAGRGRRLRRVPVHRVRTDHGRRRGAHPGRPALPRRTALPARHRPRHGRAARRERCWSAGCRSPTPWGWRSPCPRPPSARCSSSASGGGGSPRPGAAAGMLVGGGSALVAVAATMAGLPRHGLACTPCSPGPPLWSVPLGFLTMVLVSLATPSRVPAGHRRDPGPLPPAGGTAGTAAGGRSGRSR